MSIDDADAKVASREYTKMFWYIATDLSVRVISAIALIIIGAAGWKLQSDTQQQIEKKDQRDRLSRKYLPVYQTFTDLELTLQYCSDELLAMESGAHGSKTLRELSYQLDTAASSAFTADGDPIAETTFPVVDPSAIGSDQQLVHLTVPVRATSLMLADLLRLLALADSSLTPQQLNTAWIQINYSRGAARAVVLLPSAAGDTSQASVLIPVIATGVRPETEEIWQAWNGNRRISAGRLFFFKSFIARAVRQQTVTANQGLITQRPELGEEFVRIRREAVAEHLNRERVLSPKP